MIKKFITFISFIFIFDGCSSIPSKFVKTDKYGYVSKCGFFIHKNIDKKNLYVLKDDNRQIYVFSHNQYVAYNEYVGILIPIEHCNNEWCKIYYPCGDTEYFVKKDDIGLFKGK